MKMSRAIKIIKRNEDTGLVYHLKSHETINQTLANINYLLKENKISHSLIQFACSAFKYYYHDDEFMVTDRTTGSSFSFSLEGKSRIDGIMMDNVLLFKLITEIMI
jgi:hypothetical protein